MLYRQGVDVAKIARATGYDEACVVRDVRDADLTLKAEYNEILGRSRKDALCAMWLTLDGVRFEGWQAWVRSQLGTEKRRTRRTVDGDGNESTEEVVETVTSAGDPRFLSLVSDTVWRQAQLAGFVSDGQSGRVRVGSDDVEVSDEDTVAIVEVSNREQAAAVAGKRYAVLAGPDPGVVDGTAVAAAEPENTPLDT